MKVKVNTINKLIERVWSGNTVITEAQYFPKFEYIDGEFVQIESYQIKYTGNKPTQEMANNVMKFLGVELVWEEDIVPLIPYEE